jgi:hypothetical protein
MMTVAIPAGNADIANRLAVDGEEVAAANRNRPRKGISEMKNAAFILLFHFSNTG